MRKAFIFICLLLFAQNLFANQEIWEYFYNKSFDYFYNGEYEKAIQRLEGAFKLDSDQASIYWRLSYVLWFTAQRDYQQKRKIDDLTKRFYEITDKGMEICEELLKSDPNNSEILFYLGALYGNKGQFIATTNSSLKIFFKKGQILKNIEKSQRKLESIHLTEPFYYQALACLGLYNYGIVVVPAMLKKFVKGDEKLGLKQLRDAMSYAEYNDDAKIMYRGILQIMIEKDEFKDRIFEAIGLTEELLKKYSRNLSLKVDLVVLYWKKEELIRAKKISQKVRQEIIDNPEFPKIPYMRYLLYRLDNKIIPEIEKELKKK